MTYDTVNGSEILRSLSPVEEKVVYPTMYRDFSYIPGGFSWGF